MSIPDTANNLSISPVLKLQDVSVWLPDGYQILAGINWTVRPGEHWALLGPNGSGKSTLLSVAGAIRHASSGQVSILGERMGSTSVWDLRERIGVVDANQKVLEWATVLEVVLTGVTGTIWPLADRITAADHHRARELLELFGCAELTGRAFLTCSQGERQRVRIARALMSQPRLLLLDEPATGLDLPAREALMHAITELASRQPGLATVLVSHHLEELPVSTTHAMLLRAGQIVASGPAETAISSENVTRCFGFPIATFRHCGRWSARAAASWHTRREDPLASSVTEVP